MFCSKCGVIASENQKFCRSCGSRLQGDLPILDPDPKISRNGKNAVARTANKIGMIGTLTLAAALALTFISLLICSILHTELPEVVGHIFHASSYVSLIVIIIGWFLKIVGFFMGPESDDNKDSEEGYADSPRTKRLVDSHEPISSVTEHTTRSLEDGVAGYAGSTGSDSDRLFSNNRSS